MRASRAAIFLDRDGTVIEDVVYPRDPDQVRLLPGALLALRRLRQAGFALVLVSNQSGVGRGFVTEAQAQAVHERMVQILGNGGVLLDGAYYCPHSPGEGCSCRKPSPEMVQRAAVDLGIDLQRSFLIGDRLRDIEAGRRGGCRTLGLGDRCTFSGSASDVVVGDWEEIAEAILAVSGCTQ